MFKSPSLFTRIATGKLVGFIIGLMGFLLLPVLAPEADPMLRWGILFWYTTMGAFIGVMGVFTHHPVLRLPMPWWFRAPLLGSWMNFVLVFFAHEQMRGVMVAMMGPESGLTSPFWFVLEGTLVGLLIGGIATAVGGEGRATIDDSVV